MGVIVELAHAKERIKCLEDENATLRALTMPPALPSVKEPITYDVIWKIYQGLFPTQSTHIYIADTRYEITAISEIRRFVEWSKIDQLKYVSEYLDCDDFAMALAGEFARYPGWSSLPITFIWGDLHGGHAFVTAVAWKSFEDRTPKAYFIEPQTDEEITEEVVENMNLWLLPMGRRQNVETS